MNKSRQVFTRPMHAPLQPSADAPPDPTAEATAGLTYTVRVELPRLTGFDELTDTEWSAFMGLRGGPL